MLASANDLLAIHRFGRRLSVKSLETLGINRGGPPTHATLHYVFRQIAAHDLERALRGVVTTAEGLGHMAIDGKRLRGSQHLDSPGVHMLQAFSVRLRTVVGALVVPPDSGEMVEALKLIADLPVEPGDVITSDAAFTYEAVAREMRNKGADCFLFVKGNQAGLQAELAHAFGDDSPLKGISRSWSAEPAS
jgi:hypothetical protein